MRANQMFFGMSGLVSLIGAMLLLPGFLFAQDEPTPRSESVVKVSAKLSPEAPGADGKQTVTIDLDIANGWHVYANPPGQEDLASVQTSVALSSTKPLRSVKVDYPRGTTVNDPIVGKYLVYEGRQTIKANIARAARDKGALELTLKFQACNEKTCLLPATKRLTVP
jgi:DsbC/DsbD-like thiol-disulfide interchange protein